MLDEFDQELERRRFEEKVFPQFLYAQATLPQLSEAGSITFISAVSA